MDFISFARSHGVQIDPARFHPSEKIQRCGTIEKPRSDNGAYLWDGERGWVMDWSGEARVVWFQGDRARPWTDEEKRQWAAKRLSSALALRQQNDRAAEKAQTFLDAAQRKSHNYLKFKGFPEETGFVLNESLLIPMRNVKTNRLQGLQSIAWMPEDRVWRKKMSPGMRAKHAVFWLGNRNPQETWFVEGYCTGLSVKAALQSHGANAAVVVCFSASNLITVAEQIPGSRFVFADNDESKTGEKAAIETGLPWTMADTVGMDANDLHQKSGLFSVVAKIMECRTKGA